MQRPGFSILVCPDPELLRQQARSLLAAQGGGFETRVYWGDEEPSAPLPGFWQDLAVASLFGSARAVILRRAEALPDSAWKELSPRLAGFNPLVWPMLCVESPWDKGKPRLPKGLAKQKYWALAEAKGWAWLSPGVTSRSLKDVVRSGLAARGLTAPEPVLRALAEALPPDAAAIAAELDKLALAAAGRKALALADVAALSYTPELDIFNFVRAALGGGASVQVWREVLAEGQAAANDKQLFGFLAVLLREARLLGELAAGEAPSARIPDFVLDEKRKLAQRLGPRGVARLFDLALAAEMGIKTGARDPEAAFEALVAGLHPQNGRKSAPKGSFGPGRRG